MTLAELEDAEECGFITDDVREEAAKHGEVRAVELPRPGPAGSGVVAGAGLLYVAFAAVEAATACRAEMAGRAFNGQTVTAHYYPEAKFDAKQFLDIRSTTAP